jgi:hypothetical protein
MCTPYDLFHFGRRQPMNGRCPDMSGGAKPGGIRNKPEISRFYSATSLPGAISMAIGIPLFI